MKPPGYHILTANIMHSSIGSRRTHFWPLCPGSAPSCKKCRRPLAGGGLARRAVGAVVAVDDEAQQRLASAGGGSNGERSHGVPPPPPAPS